MSLTDTQQSTPSPLAATQASRPRIGVPWRTSAEEQKFKANGKRGKTQDYIDAIERAGGEAVPVSLDEKEREGLVSKLDAFVLPGSPADVNPQEYQAKNTGSSNEPDIAREKTDRTILELAFAQKKPVLAICYGFQNLNVHLKGSLIQDIRTELKDKTASLERHQKQDSPRSETDPEHYVALESGSRLAGIAGGTKAFVNSSHHQAIGRVGNDLKIAARAKDGIVEGLEWTGDSNWVVGVQWHPERRPLEDAFAKKLFEEFVAAAAKAREHADHKA